MPPRPVLKVKQNRPLSAVYIGKGPAPNLQHLLQSPQQSSSYSSIAEGDSLPDLPEPPSPSSSIGSVRSGLPSPPATNSTGSGSTGDPATIAVRERPLSLHSNSSASTSSGSHHTVSTPMKRSGNGVRSRSNSSLAQYPDTSGDFDDDYDNEKNNDNENDLDGDDTARLDRKLLANADNGNHKGSSENVLALQRVKTLAQRNRMALDKLSSISRLSSPSPRPNSRSPAPSQTSSGSSSRLAPHPRQVRALPQIPPHHQDQGRSGSETERESTHHSHSSHSSSSHSHTRSVSSFHYKSPSMSSSSSLRPITPEPPAQNNNTPSSPYHRLRHISAPDSPNKARLISAGTTSSGSNTNISRSPSSRRRHRASMASISAIQLTDFEEEDDDDGGLATATGTARDRTREKTLNERDLITQSALAAVASSRRSPLGTRRRGALPREFRGDLVDSSPSPSPGVASGSGTARTTSAAGRYDNRRGSLDGEERVDSWKQNPEPVTPFRGTSNGVGRSSTVRDYGRSGGSKPRWSSGDFRPPSTGREQQFDTSYPNEDDKPKNERRQSLRGGSAESALGVWSPGGRLVGEGLRAAGLSVKIHDDPRNDVFKEKLRKVDWSPQEVLDQERRRVFSDRERERQRQRPATSMADYRYLDKEDVADGGHREGGREQAMNRHKSTLALSSRDRETSLTRRNRERDALTLDRVGSSLSRYNNTNTPHTASPAPLPATPLHLHERLATASPFGSRRHNAHTAGQASTALPQTEHARLMLESLSIFESQLVKLPQLSTTTSSAGTGASHSELAKNAQSMVYAAERLAGLLKLGGARALDAQVEAEVEGGANDGRESAIWGQVATEYREGMRTTDDLVRGITGFLLGVGRVMRDLGSSASEFGSPSVHGRHASLDDSGRNASPDVGSAGSGRQSVSSRRSWEPRDRDRDREDALRRLAGAGPRPESVLARASPATFQKLRADRELQHETPPPPPARHLASVRGVVDTGSVRKLFTPREQREQAMDARAAGHGTHTMGRSGGGMPAHDSQETVQAPQKYEPSPTPPPRNRGTPAPDRTRALPPIAIPKPLPTLPSESKGRHRAASTNTTAPLPSRERERKTTIRGVGPSFPSITTPISSTTALTPHTVSNTPDRTVFPLLRTDSGKSNRSQVTFSRPAAVSVSAALSGLHQQHMDGERKRTISSTPNDEPSTSAAPPQSAATPVSGSETERDVRRRTIGTRTMRMSLDGLVEQQLLDEERSGSRRVLDARAADRSAASMHLQHQEFPGAVRGRDRRRTITEIWT
ncbi:hypothetical protein B0H34DRAFT_797374 [Crassisporium funariophilum]|nr:hypothetical protein B0H34DRAFT_797374 [Crassisporium funariophilum]